MVHRYVMSTDTCALWMGRKDFIFYFSLVCKNLTDSAVKSCFTIPDAPEQDAGNPEWSSSSRMGFMSHNWSATKQRLHLQSVAETSRHSVLSGDRIPEW